jgi:hypothetical protein
MSVKVIRRLAEQNLCKVCFEKYKQLLEPTIKSWRASPLFAWNPTEWMITVMVMKLEGVYKDEKYHNSWSGKG